LKEVTDALRRYPASTLATYHFNEYPWLNPDALRKIAEDIVKAEAELSEAEQQAARLGAVLPPHFS
jgi:hypothetical protein